MTPHVPQNTSGRRSAVPDVIARSDGYAISCDDCQWRACDWMHGNGALSPGLKPQLPCRCAMQALLTDLVADSVFLLVQRALLPARDMAAVLVGSASPRPTM